MAKKSSAFASIYLLESIMYCNIFGGNSYLFLMKFGVQHDFLCT